ncbi:large conductance mechanosensitive channel protein MscL [Corynebacterium jeikeium]|uniref:Large-conductance mechanosensitive channel n=1 Tax=Corynebacterium jeikeium (strain K411) TaxID=306537 RepID=Q4JU07_CORJK|nr:large conductance mechanosensitive channel protein MscL [Corynebacterium jeikeium]EEW17284.1 large conductance mechanosensitive channel protein [Corynebacterium jeikeium ATCC 43734]OOD32528.1 mechanosensitive ion channel protein MscL [Corynebacterium jeikeium]WCZ54195.1 Large-conductance mechanosensitive channel [Corynebacterium jeikeium]CAI37700.1 mscL [Corynebacterium jeikeium K411]SUY80499.1 Large-conductance mechanosensitive channel [Corynebacterium jeikeium]
MLEGFKKFIMRGNVMELAVAVIIGGAFTAIVTAFTSGIVEPLLAAVGGSPEFGMGFHLREGNDATFVNIGAVLTAAVNFLIIAAVIYFLMIMPMNKLAEMNARRKGIEPEEAAATETELLAEIRDLLLEQRGGEAEPTGKHAEN